MPEGPELALAGRYVNALCGGLVFAGAVERSPASKSPAVPFASAAYRVSAAARGKELRLTLAPLAAAEGGAALVLRFGMSGALRLCAAAAAPRHTQLRFVTRERPPRALCFVDPRRFGRWHLGAHWQRGRGPCVLAEYEAFRDNVLRNLEDRAFERPICEALLNQKYFNGIGNYLRAEILYRLRIPPFEKARTVLEALKHREQDPSLTLSRKLKLKRENPDLLELCHTVPMEVVELGGKAYDPEHLGDDTAFRNWLQCYSVPGMNSLRDGKGRTIWFQGEPGPMAPKGGKTPRKRAQRKAEPDVVTPEVQSFVVDAAAPASVAPVPCPSAQTGLAFAGGFFPGVSWEPLVQGGEPGPTAPRGGTTRRTHAQLKAEPDVVTPQAQTVPCEVRALWSPACCCRPCCGAEVPAWPPGDGRVTIQAVFQSLL
ncbi:endonuclease 8-like 1 [Eudromia elegans]